jgi:hypothetical protein
LELIATVALFQPCAAARCFSVGWGWGGLYIRAQEKELMSQVLMPKATAVWLVENTTLTFDQISAFTGLHPLEVQAIADGEVAGGMTGLDPTTNGQLTKEEIKRAEGDPSARLKLSPRDVPEPIARSKGPRYTPVAKRQDRPDAIAWLLKVHPELQDSQVAKLVGSTKSTVQSVRDRTHWNMQNVRPRDPVTLGLCTLKDLNDAVDKARRKAAREDAAKKKAAAKASTVGETAPEEVAEEQPAETPVDPADADQPDVGETPRN